MQLSQSMTALVLLGFTVRLPSWLHASFKFGIPLCTKLDVEAVFVFQMSQQVLTSFLVLVLSSLGHSAGILLFLDSPP